jgi:hypothetical protein
MGKSNIAESSIMKQLLEDILSILVPSALIVALSFLITYFLVGCNFIQVEAAQRTIVDVGDGTADNYTTHNKKTNSDTTDIKLLPQ